MNYRNKTIFDYSTYKPNDIYSIESINFMNMLKEINYNINIHNVIFRNIEKDVSIILQIDRTIFRKEEGNIIFNFINNLCNNNQLNLKLFAIQYLQNNKFEKDTNIFYYKKEYIKFNVDYLDNKQIYLLPDSFYQANISVLPQFYKIFIGWIQVSKCKNIINLGDDGGNVCTILYSLFDNLISYFHCSSSFDCASRMIQSNNLSNFKITFDIENIYSFSRLNSKTILFINPGRKGLRDYEIEFIKSSNINYIIYMACNEKAFLKNLNELNDYIILDHRKILNMPIINKYQHLYFLYKLQIAI